MQQPRKYFCLFKSLWNTEIFIFVDSLFFVLLFNNSFSNYVQQCSRYLFWYRTTLSSINRLLCLLWDIRRVFFIFSSQILLLTLVDWFHNKTSNCFQNQIFCYQSIFFQVSDNNEFTDDMYLHHFSIIMFTSRTRSRRKKFLFISIRIKLLLDILIKILPCCGINEDVSLIISSQG